MRRNVIATVIAIVALGGAAVFVASRIDNDCGAAGVPATDNPDVRFESAADGFTLRVTSDEDFHVGALDWILRIGDVQFYRSQYPDFTLAVIEFQIPQSALELLDDGAPITVHYGNPRSASFDIEPDPPGVIERPMATFLAASCE